jgi:hypothetical protein
MQSTGQTSMQASQPVQLSARMTASSLGSFFLALPAPFAMTYLSKAWHTWTTQLYTINSATSGTAGR